VSKYGVDVAAIDRFAAALPDPANPSLVYLIDEIGKMECLSASFVQAMTHVIKSGAALVATVAQHGGGFIEEVKRHRDAEVWTVTQTTRETLPDRIVQWIEQRT
jgi:nucleoside-triphosphatase